MLLVLIDIFIQTNMHERMRGRLYSVGDQVAVTSAGKHSVTHIFVFVIVFVFVPVFVFVSVLLFASGWQVVSRSGRSRHTSSTCDLSSQQQQQQLAV